MRACEGSATRFEWIDDQVLWTMTSSVRLAPRGATRPTTTRATRIALDPGAIRELGRGPGQAHEGAD